jgi:hypothetical protein
MFDPAEVREAKRQRRNEAVGIKPPATATATTTPSPVNFGSTTEARDRTLMENYLELLDKEGPHNPGVPAARLYGKPGMPSNRDNFVYSMTNQKEFIPRLVQRYGKDRAGQIIHDLSAPTTGERGVF